MTNSYIFCIDTDQYAGNFERQMCAFMTGMFGDCGVGEEEADRFEGEGLEPLEDLVVSMMDDRGCFRPATIVPTPGWFNAGGQSFRDGSPDEHVRSAVIRSLREQADNNRKGYADKAYGESRAKEIEEEIRAFEQDEDWTRYLNRNAYNSVGIHLSHIPTSDEINFLKTRAELYAKDPGSKWVSSFKIEGYRLLTIRTVEESTAI